MGNISIEAIRRINGKFFELVKLYTTEKDFMQICLNLKSNEVN
jgi:hypothetical protein